MGPEAAARWAAKVLVDGVTAVVVAGVAGGCDPAVVPGTVVVAAALCDLEGRPIESPPPPAGVTAAVLHSVPRAAEGTVASGGDVVDDPAWRGRLATVGALAVETEAAGWAPACRRAGIALVVVRAVLDTPARPLGAVADLLAPGEDAPPPRRLIRLLARPSSWTALPRLARDSVRAERGAAIAALSAAAALME